MLIREASVEDAAAIARVQVDTWRTAYAGIAPADYLAGLSYDERAQQRQALLADPGDLCVFVTEDDGGEVTQCKLPKRCRWAMSAMERWISPRTGMRRSA